jgi:hypothetical protein
MEKVIQFAEISNQSDPFDLDNLRLNQSFAESVGLKKLLRTVPVRKPNKQDFVRVHPDEAYRSNFPIISLHEDREDYIVCRRGDVCNAVHRDQPTRCRVLVACAVAAG